MAKNAAIQFPFLIALAVTLVACGGGGGGGKAPPASAATDSTSSSGTPINRDLTGKLYFEWINEYIELDLATGVPTRMRSAGWGESPSPKGEEFVQIVDGYEFFQPDTDLLAYFGRDGLSISSAEFANELDLIGPARISHDGKYTAVYFAYDPVYYDNVANGLAIVDRLGKQQQFIEGNYINGWDWTADGQLIIIDNDSFYRVPKIGDLPQLIVKLTLGYPRNLTISPDGSKIAFTVWDGTRKVQDVYIMNIDGTEQRKLVTTNTNSNTPEWSPDGRYLAIQSMTAQTIVTTDCAYGTECSPTPPIESKCSGVFVVPSDASGVDLNASDISPAFRVAMMEEKNKAHYFTCAQSVAWRPTLAPLPTSPGTPVTGDGVNGSLAGRILITDPDIQSDFMMLDVASGQATSIPDHYRDYLTPGVSASVDGQEIIYAGDPDNRSLYHEQMNVERLDGTITSTFNVLGSINGVPKLSHDGQYIVAYQEYDNKSDGTSGVRIFDRQGNTLREFPGYGDWAWLPDGRLVLGSGGYFNVTDASLQNPTLFASMSNWFDDPDVSPDGRRIAFSMVGHIWVVNIDGTGLKQLTISSGIETTPSWSPDGRYVVFKHYDGSDNSCQKLYAVPADGERVLVGNTSVASTAQKIWHSTSAGVYDVCLHGRGEPSWRP